MSLLIFTIVLPFIFCVFVPQLYKLRSIHTGWFILPVPVALFAYFLMQIPHIQEGNDITSTLSWVPSLGMNVTVILDGLGLLFALLITGIGSLVTLYSIYYMDKQKEAIHQFYIYLLMFMGAMLGVVLSDNLMVLYGFWEMTSISSFLLIAFWNQREKSIYGAQKSMLITMFGGFAMFAGFLFIYVMTGTFSVREIMGQIDVITEHYLFLPAMILIVLGAFTKSVQFPFHIWLPDAMAAPTPVSAYLHSATMVKAGLYLIARFSPMFAGEPVWFWMISGVGLLTMIYGSFRAIKQKDLKAMLAFSTISQLGLIMCLLGLGSAAGMKTDVNEAVFYSKATTAAIFHLINHAVFKGALFMVVGIVDHETGTRDLRKLGGLMSVMPITFTIALIGTFSMAGLPPFNGFLSKEMFFTSVLNIMELNVWNLQTWGALFPVIAWIGSIFTFIYSMVLLFKTFTGKASFDKLEKSPHEAPIGMLISPVILGSLAVIIGIFPNLLSYSIIEPAMAAVVPDLLKPGEKFLVNIEFWHGWTVEIFMTLSVIVIGFLLYKVYGRLNVMNRASSGRFSLNRAYDWSLQSLESLSQRLTNRYMTGSVRHYLLYIFGFMIFILVVTFIRTEGITFAGNGFAPISIYECILIIAMMMAAIFVPFARSRVMAIIFTGAVGYLITLLFVLFKAPDLALTQMVVETVSVTLFLLCFNHLPKMKKEIVPLRRKTINLLISAGVGAIVTVIALAALSGKKFEAISDYFVQASYNLAGGTNVVNVILVDFRGFDTMLEIVVLGIASLGIYSLVKLKLDRGAIHSGSWMPSAEQSHSSHLPKSNDVILKTSSRFLFFIIMTFSWFLFFAGHNDPGGGFIGGLVTAAGLVLFTVAFGMSLFERMISVDFIKVLAIGLLTALLTGVGSFFFDVPFLTHTFGYFNIPLLGKTELATAVLFDLGVYLTVVSVAMTIILTIWRDKPIWK